MRRLESLLAAALLSTACRAPAAEAPPVPPSAPPAAAAQEREPGPGSEQEAPTAPAAAREADALLDTGIVLRSHEERGWGLSLLLPVSIGLTGFDLDQAFTLDQLATVAVVPTAEFIVPLGERWTLLPFVGLGGAWQSGASELVGGNHWLGLATIGVRATRWQGFAHQSWFGFSSQVRYDAALGVPDGVLGDWGSWDASLELRRDFGAPREGPRFQGGVYVQGTWFFDPVELDVVGLAPEIVVDNAELGLSFGSTEPYKLLGITLPRVFIGYVIANRISGLRVRFGRL